MKLWCQEAVNHFWTKMWQLMPSNVTMWYYGPPCKPYGFISHISKVAMPLGIVWARWLFFATYILTNWPKRVSKCLFPSPLAHYEPGPALKIQWLAWEHGFAGGFIFGKTPCHVAWELCFVAVFEKWLSCSLKLAQGGQQFMFPSRYSCIMFTYCHSAWETIHRDTTFLHPYFIHIFLPNLFNLPCTTSSKT